MKKILLFTLLAPFISCKKDTDSVTQPKPDPVSPKYSLRIRCSDYKLDTTYLANGYGIIHYRCVGQRIDTVWK